MNSFKPSSEKEKLSHKTEEKVVRTKLGLLNKNTPRTSMPSKTLDKRKQQSSIASFLTPVTKPKKILTKEQEIQTESKCTCDLDDAAGLEMMSSQFQIFDFFQKTAEELEPNVSKLVERKMELQAIVDKRSRKIKELEDRRKELEDIVETGYKLADLAVKYHQNVRPIINTKDSATLDPPSLPAVKNTQESFQSLAIDTSRFELAEDDDEVEDFSACFDDELAKEVEEMLEKEAQEEASLKSTSLRPEETIRRRKIEKEQQEILREEKLQAQKYPQKKNLYTQSSICCCCDWSDDDHMTSITGGDMNELLYQYRVNMLRRNEMNATVEIEHLEVKLPDLDEKLKELKVECEKLQLKANDVFELEEQLERVIDDSGFGNELEESR